MIEEDNEPVSGEDNIVLFFYIVLFIVLIIVFK